MDPIVTVKPSKNQVEDVLSEIKTVVANQNRVLITTLTKKSAEDLTEHLENFQIKVRYLHSDINTVERVEIITDLRKGEFDVLVGINLLREGLDIPEVELVAILDADMEGFLRSDRSLIQTIGRAARLVNGRAILYADKLTKSIKKTVEETEYRRKKQSEFNLKNKIVPRAVVKPFKNPLTERILKTENNIVNDDIIDFEIPSTPREYDKKIRELRKEMEKSAKELDFQSAAFFRDQIRKMNEIKSNRN